MDVDSTINNEYFLDIISHALTKAASSLSGIAQKQVKITVPSFELVDDIEVFISKISDDNIEVMVQSEINGDLYGQTILLFSSKQIEDLEEACFDFKIQPGDKTEIRKSFLLEVSNILTETIVTEFSNRLYLNLYGSVPLDPVPVKGLSKEKLILNLDVSYMIFTVYTSFVEHGKNVSLPMMLVFDYENLRKIIELIKQSMK